MDNTAANATRACGPAGSLMMYVSKMVLTSDKGRLHAFGRMFTGTVATGQKVKIQGPHHTPSSKENLNMRDPVVSYRQIMDVRTPQIQEDLLK